MPCIMILSLYLEGRLLSRNAVACWYGVVAGRTLWHTSKFSKRGNEIDTKRKYKTRTLQNSLGHVLNVSDFSKNVPKTFSWTTAGLFRKIDWCLPCSSYWVVWIWNYNHGCWDTGKAVSAAHPCWAILKNMPPVCLYLFMCVWEFRSREKFGYQPILFPYSVPSRTFNAYILFLCSIQNIMFIAKTKYFGICNKIHYYIILKHQGNIIVQSVCVLIAFTWDEPV